MLAPGCRILSIFATRCQVYGAHGCHLTCLVPLLWRPGTILGRSWTILGRSWDIGGHKEGACEVQARILSICCWFRGAHFESFLGTFGPRKLKKHIYVQVVFSNGFWVWIWVSVKKQAFGKGHIAKTKFCRNWVFRYSRVRFSWFLLAFGQISMILWHWGMAWNFRTFQRDSGVTPDPANPPGWR